MNVETASKLVGLRKAAGLSQEELAEKIGVSRQAISKWERAESSPDLDNVVLLARLYNMSLDELLLSENSDEGATAPKPFEASEKDEPVTNGEFFSESFQEDFANESESAGAESPDEMDNRFEARAESISEQVSAAVSEAAENFARGIEQGVLGAFGAANEQNETDVHSSKEEYFYSESFAEGQGSAYEHSEKQSFPRSSIKKMLDNSYPVLATCAYLILGFIFDWWHPTWLVFLTIPLYYTMTKGVLRTLRILQGKEQGNPMRAIKQMMDGSYPVLVTFVFLLTGCVAHIWHPTWMWFLTIPLYYTMMPALVKATDRRAE